MERKPRFSRRDFLITAGLSAGALAISPKIYQLLNPENTSENSDLKAIETDEAIYYPVYDRHDRLPDLVKIFNENKIVPDLQFYELVDKESSARFNSGEPDFILKSEYKVPFLNVRGRLISDSTLDYFAKKGVKVSFEGIGFSPDYLITSLGTRSSESALLFAGFAAAFLHRLWDMSNHNPYSVKKLFIDLAKAVPLTWLGGSKVADNIVFDLSKNENLHQIYFPIARASSLLEHFHPEDLQVFLRNLIMARKLQFLGSFLGNAIMNRKPIISFQAGYAHMGINDFLKLGEEVTLIGLSVYPKDFLRGFIESNRGINAFCSTLVISNVGSPAKTIILDEKLKNYLEERLK